MEEKKTQQEFETVEVCSCKFTYDWQIEFGGKKVNSHISSSRRPTRTTKLFDEVTYVIHYVKYTPLIDEGEILRFHVVFLSHTVPTGRPSSQDT